MQNKESFTRWLPLVGLTFAVFVFNTSEFMPIGLLTDIAMSIFSGIFNLGIGSGAYIGGLVVSRLSIEYIGYAGGAIGMIATLYLTLRYFPNMRRREAADIKQK